jgi:hypothetical protein
MVIIVQEALPATPSLSSQVKLPTRSFIPQGIVAHGRSGLPICNAAVDPTHSFVGLKGHAAALRPWAD